MMRRQRVEPQLDFHSVLQPPGGLVLAVTGHRADDTRPWRGVGGRSYVHLHQRCIAAMEEVVVSTPWTHIITGMALETDTWMAELAVKHSKPFTAAIPFDGQELRWPPEAQMRYRELLRLAAEVVNVSGYSVPGALARGELAPSMGRVRDMMNARNRWMVDRCDVVLGLWDGSPGGTGNTMKYAMPRVPTIRIDPSTLR